MSREFGVAMDVLLRNEWNSDESAEYIPSSKFRVFHIDRVVVTHYRTRRSKYLSQFGLTVTRVSIFNVYLFTKININIVLLS